MPISQGMWKLIVLFLIVNFCTPLDRKKHREMSVIYCGRRENKK